MHMNKYLFLSIISLALMSGCASTSTKSADTSASAPVEASVNKSNPDCTGPDNWPTAMAFVHLKNAYLTDNYKVDFYKTVTEQISSERLGPDLFRQVHLVKFTEKSGNIIQVITVNDASNDECSMSDVDVYVISNKLGRM